MERTTKIIRPPQVHDLWYVKVHHAACTVELDTVLVTEMTPETVLLVFLELPPQNGAAVTARYATKDVVWVEHVRVMPRVVQMAAPTYFYSESELKPCPTNLSDPTAPPSEHPPQGPAGHNVRHLVRPPTPK